MNILYSILILVFQQSGLEYIYDKLSDRMPEEHVFFTTDKDYYFVGEYVHVSGAMIQSLRNADKSSWAYLFLFNEERKVLNYTRFLMTDDLIKGSILISDTISTSAISIGVLIPERDDLFYSKPVSIIDARRSSLIEPNVSFEVKTRSDYLIPGIENEIYVLNSTGETKNVILDGVKHQLSERSILRLTPKEDAAYELIVGDEVVLLPEVKKIPYFDSDLINSTINYHINGLDGLTDTHYFIVLSGNEVLWLSELDKPIEISIDLNDIETSFVSAYILDANYQLLYKEITPLPDSKAVSYSVIGDSLLLADSLLYKNHTFVLRLSDPTFLFDRTVYINAQEYMELSRFHDMPDHTIYFKTTDEKMAWINYELKSKLTPILTEASPETIIRSKTETPKINFLLTDVIKKPEYLKINAIDLAGGIVDYELNGDTLSFDVSKFQDPTSQLAFSINYKNKEIGIKKLESHEISFIESALTKKRITNSLVNASNPSDFFEYNDLNTEAKFLAEVVVTSTKERPVFNGEGTMVMHDELDLTNHTNTADAFLIQIGIMRKADPITGYLASDKGIWDNRAGTYRTGFPMFLVITGSSGLYYAGYDFNRLKNFPAEWVYSMVKINSEPERVIIALIPGFRGEDSSVISQLIYAPFIENENAGVYLWAHDVNGELSHLVLTDKAKEFEVDVFVLTRTN